MMMMTFSTSPHPPCCRTIHRVETRVTIATSRLKIQDIDSRVSTGEPSFLDILKYSSHDSFVEFVSVQKDVSFRDVSKMWISISLSFLWHLLCQHTNIDSRFEVRTKCEIWMYLLCVSV